MTPERFWSWFTANEQRFRNIEGPRNELPLDELLGALQEYSEGLWFEVGGAPEGPRELIISAEGDTQYFSAITTLVNAAPQIEGWRIIAFKPAHGFDFTTDYEGVRVVSQAAWFLPLQSQSDPNELGLLIGLPEFDETLEDEYWVACYKVLDTGLGEFQTAEKIKHVEVCKLPEHPEAEGFIELPELPDYIKWREKREDA